MAPRLPRPEGLHQRGQPAEGDPVAARRSVGPGTSGTPRRVAVVASGLDNPRGLAFAPNGALIVAEAGKGGAGPCREGPEGGTVCFGASGALTVVRNGHQSRVLSGLPSLADPDGSTAIGPSDVSFDGLGGTYLTVGLGANPALRRQVPELAGMAKLLRVNPARGTTRVAADAVLSDGLVAPGGLAIRGDAAYVSNCGVCAGNGTVLRVPLH